jgi:hypothetical protein
VAVSEAKPEVSIKSLSLSGVSAEAKVSGEMAAKLWHTPTGAVAWTSSTRGEWTLGKVTSTSLRINDPEEQYYQIIDDLVWETTRDFRPTTEERTVTK